MHVDIVAIKPKRADKRSNHDTITKKIEIKQIIFTTVNFLLKFYDESTQLQIYKII